ncbi:MAG: hypothetical protein GX800_05250 [Clostridiaceae bacterium]|nr:hypothetical protein [Clostridiaceae bacterium]
MIFFGAQKTGKIPTTISINMAMHAFFNYSFFIPSAYDDIFYVSDYTFLQFELLKPERSCTDNKT